MNYYAIMIEGTGLLVRTEKSEAEIWGCYCTRYILNNNMDEAVRIAKTLIQSELLERGILCEEKQLIVESVKEVGEIPVTVADKGFTFYPIDESTQY